MYLKTDKDNKVLILNKSDYYERVIIYNMAKLLGKNSKIY